MLHDFVSLHRDEIIARCRAKVTTRSIPPPTTAEIDHGVPLFLDQLVAALRLGMPPGPEIRRSAVLHGRELLRQGLTASQVVHDYGDVCQSITDLAVETKAAISTEDFRMLNACLDDAIAGAVTEYGRERSQSAAESARENERFGFFAHELRNLIHTAMMAYDVVKSGDVGIGGSTGAVLHRSLVGARDLVARSLAEVRLTQGLQHPQQIPLADFIDEVAPAARLGAEAGGVLLTVLPVDANVMVKADRQIMAAVAMNLLQNAFKFTRPGTSVVLRVVATADRVLLEVQDECGGLPGGNVDDLFRPFEQRSVDRTGLGLGLAFSRWGVEANHGKIYARDLPGTGCVFTIDLPRLQVPATAA